MTKEQAEKRASELNAMAKRDEYKAMRTHNGEWFIARTFVAKLDNNQSYIGISLA